MQLDPFVEGVEEGGVVLGQRSYIRRIVSTFSCDIATRSPAASSAFSGSRNARKQTSFPSRNFSIQPAEVSVSASAASAAIVNATDEERYLADAETGVHIGAHDLPGFPRSSM